MDIAQLEQIVEVDRVGSLSKAALHLGYTQPTLSRSIQRLENELGCKILTRTKNSVHVNEYGRLVVDSAQKILQEYENLRTAIAQKKGKDTTVVIATCAPAPLWSVTDMLISSIPGIMIGPKMEDESAVERSVMRQDADIAITTRKIVMPGIQCRKLFEERLYVAVPKDNALAQNTSLTWDDIDGQDFIVLSDIGIWNEFCTRHLKHSNIVVQPDRTIFNRLAIHTKRLYFVTNESFSPHAPKSRKANERRTIVPISSDNALTFYVCISISAPEPIQHALGF